MLQRGFCCCFTKKLRFWADAHCGLQVMPVSAADFSDDDEAAVVPAQEDSSGHDSGHLISHLESEFASIHDPLEDEDGANGSNLKKRSESDASRLRAVDEAAAYLKEQKAQKKSDMIAPANADTDRGAQEANPTSGFGFNFPLTCICFALFIHGLKFCFSTTVSTLGWISAANALIVNT